MDSRIADLTPREQHSSRPRCLRLTDADEPRVVVARRLTHLSGNLARVDPTIHQWRPRGFLDKGEIQLGKSQGLLTDEEVDEITSWWLVYRRAKKPAWDIASSAIVDGRRGLLLVEAKAHASELKRENDRCTSRHTGNRQRIAAAVAEANSGLGVVVQGWALSRDDRYQLANRFAWAWKLASMGVPVVLVYLGFLKANEEIDPFADGQVWEDSVRHYAAGAVPQEAWNSCLTVHNARTGSSAPMWALIRTLEIGLG
jgi:hypothetical protein